MMWPLPAAAAVLCFRRCSHSGRCEVLLVQETAEQLRPQQRRGSNAGFELREDAVEIMQRRRWYTSGLRFHQDQVWRQLLLRTAREDGAAHLGPNTVHQPSNAVHRQRLRDEPSQFLLRFPASNDQDGVSKCQRGQSRRDQEELPASQLMHAVVRCSHLQFQAVFVVLAILIWLHNRYF